MVARARVPKAAVDGRIAVVVLLAVDERPRRPRARAAHDGVVRSRARDRAAGLRDENARGRRVEPRVAGDGQARVRDREAALRHQTRGIVDHLRAVGVARVRERTGRRTGLRAAERSRVDRPRAVERDVLRRERLTRAGSPRSSDAPARAGGAEDVVTGALLDLSTVDDGVGAAAWASLGRRQARGGLLGQRAACSHSRLVRPARGREHPDQHGRGGDHEGETSKATLRVGLSCVRLHCVSLSAARRRSLDPSSSPLPCGRRCRRPRAASRLRPRLNRARRAPPSVRRVAHRSRTPPRRANPPSASRSSS